MTEFLEVRCPFIKAGIPTVHGRVYTEDVLKKMVKQTKDKRIVGMFGIDPATATTTHVLKELRYVDGGLTAVVELIGNDAKNKQLKELHGNKTLGMFPVINTKTNNNGYIDINSVELISVDLAALESKN